MVVHMVGLAGLKAHGAHHVGAAKVAPSSGGGGGGGGGSSAASQAATYVAIFVSIKALGYTGATYLWSTVMGAAVGGPVGAIVGAAVSTEVYKEKASAAGKDVPEEVDDTPEGELNSFTFQDRDGDKCVFEKREGDQLWYVAKTTETVQIESLSYDSFSRTLKVEQSYWQIPLRQNNEKETLAKLRKLCNDTGTPHSGLKMSRPMTDGEKQAGERGLMAGLCLGCGIGAACGAGVGSVVLGAGDCGGNTLMGNVAQTLMIKHVTCPVASCCGALGGGSAGFCVGKCCSPGVSDD